MTSREKAVKWWKAGRALVDEMDRKNLGLIAAGVAFYAMLAIFPAITAIISLFGLVADPAAIETMLGVMQEIMPEEAYRLFDDQIARLVSAQTDKLGWTGLLSLLVALWLARVGVAALIRGLNAIYERPNRGGVRHLAVALMLTVSLVGVAIVALLAVVVSPIILAFLPLGPAAALAAELSRWAIAFSVIVAGLGLLYRFGPNARGERHGWFTSGALLTLVFWLIASIGFSIYLANFGRYNEVYGSIGAVVAMLIWLWISAYLVLAGAAFNAVMRRVRRRAGSDERTRAIR